MSSLALLLALLVAPEDTPKPATAPSASAARAASSTSAVTSKTIVGEIVWVDFPSRLALVRESVKSTPVKGRPAARETVALAIGPDVPVIRGKQPSTFSELKPKDHVVARYVSTATGARAVSLRVADASVVPRATSGAPVAAPPPGGSSTEAD